VITSSCTRFRWSFRRDWGLYGEAEARSPKGLKAWMQPCYRWNPPFDLLQREELDRLGGHDVVVLNAVAVLGEEELAALTAQVRTLAPTKRLAPVQVLAREALPGAYLPLFLWRSRCASEWFMWSRSSRPMRRIRSPRVCWRG